jgi:hypothetical protein
LDELEDAEEMEEEEIPKIAEVKKSEPAPIESLTRFSDATPNTRLNRYTHWNIMQQMENLLKTPFEFFYLFLKRKIFIWESIVQDPFKFL